MVEHAKSKSTQPSRCPLYSTCSSAAGPLIGIPHSLPYPEEAGVGHAVASAEEEVNTSGLERPTVAQGAVYREMDLNFFQKLGRSLTD